MTTRQLLTYFIGLSPWVNPSDTVDRIRYGNPDAEIGKIGVGYSACDQNLIRAGEEGCNLFISHEVSLPSPEDKQYGSAWAVKKRNILTRYGMTTLNLHDTWDHFPEYGIRDAFAEFLQLDSLIAELDYVHPWNDAVTTGGKSIGLYAVSPVTLHEFCLHMARRLSAFKGCGLQYYGNGGAVIRSVAIGVGCHIPTFEALERGADLLVMVYDRAFEIGTRLWLADSGARLVVIEHSLSEIPAMKKMATYIKTHLRIPAVFYNEEPKYTYVLADANQHESQDHR